MNQAKKKTFHYFFNSNPYRVVDSIEKFINTECLYQSEKLVAYYKPPDFSFDLSKCKTTQEKAYCQKLKDEIKSKYKWEKICKFSFVDYYASGIAMFTPSNESREVLRNTVIRQFTSTNFNFLKYYAITSFIPMTPRGREVFQSVVQTHDNVELLVEEKNPSKRQILHNLANTHQIEHRVVDYNQKLNVALVELSSTYNNNDGIELYCAKNLFPCLGDHKYSHLVKTIRNRPVFADYKNYKRMPQNLNPFIMQALNLNSYMTVQVPLHLHLHEINLEKKFKKQKIITTVKSKLPDYFVQTLSNLNLDPNRNLNTENVENAENNKLTS